MPGCNYACWIHYKHHAKTQSMWSTSLHWKPLERICPT